MSRATFPVPLDCGHVQGYANPYPKAGEVAYCRRCSDWRKAIETVEESAKIVCADCRYCRNYPITTAKLQAKAHLVRHAGHHTRVLNADGETVEEYDGYQGIEIEGLSLREISRNAASLLRAREG